MPAACYPVYPAIAARGRLPPGGAFVDAGGAWVFRHEPSLDPARRQIFHQHELVRIGEPEAVLAWRDEWAPARPRAAAGAGPRGRARQRQRSVLRPPRDGCSPPTSASEALKLELLVQIAGPEPTALASFNHHRDHFGGTYGIELAGGGIAHTACLGFGHERIVLALLRTHGLDPSNFGRRCARNWSRQGSLVEVLPAQVGYTDSASARELIAPGWLAGERAVWLALEPHPVLAFLFTPEADAMHSQRPDAPRGPARRSDGRMCSYRGRRAWAQGLAQAGFPAATEPSRVRRQRRLPAGRKPARRLDRVGVRCGTVAYRRHGRRARRCDRDRIGRDAGLPRARGRRADRRPGPVGRAGQGQHPGCGSCAPTPGSSARAIPRIIAPRWIRMESTSTPGSCSPPNRAGPRGAPAHRPRPAPAHRSPGADARPGWESAGQRLAGAVGAIGRERHRAGERRVPALMLHPQEAQVPAQTVAATRTWLGAEPPRAHRRRRFTSERGRALERECIELTWDGATVRETPLRVEGPGGACSAC